MIGAAELSINEGLQSKATLQFLEYMQSIEAHNIPISYVTAHI